MTVASLSSVANVYQVQQAAVITRHRVDCDVLARYCLALKQLQDAVGPAAQADRYWIEFFRPLNRLKFDLCAAPLSTDYKNKRIASLLEDLEEHLSKCADLYPSLSDRARALLPYLEALTHQTSDPLLATLIGLTQSNERTGWVIKKGNLIPFVLDALEALNLSLSVEILRPVQLKALTVYDRLIIVGSVRWFESCLHVVTAPRAKQIDVVLYDWITDSWKPTNVFASPLKPREQPYSRGITLRDRPPSLKWKPIDAETFLMENDTEQSVRAALERRKTDDIGEVPAVCAVIDEGRKAILYDASDQATMIVIDPDQESKNRVKRILVKELIPGLFVLVRTSGGGDYIVPVADRILGSLAPKARAYQSDWKQRLTRYVVVYGTSKTVADLCALGSEVASEQNLYNWMSPRSIRTKFRTDFLAILKLIGLEDEASTYWAMMSKIHAAHVSAGQQIRRTLLDQIKYLDAEDLNTQAQLDFRMPGSEEAEIRAYRVEKILPDTIRVHYSRLGEPIVLE